ncbi:hypothetical protein [Nostoc sp. XA010]|uniref:hypothetical protein n=1 Tax=Nostoc sp. XA010 TaxID=2780407 RepID=UPI001E5A1DF5|nr:hypothetical protein [Nostoc sp. XA010]
MSQLDPASRFSPLRVSPTPSHEFLNGVKLRKLSPGYKRRSRFMLASCFPSDIFEVMSSNYAYPDITAHRLQPF